MIMTFNFANVKNTNKSDGSHKFLSQQIIFCYDEK
jgi:hypothetical protein